MVSERKMGQSMNQQVSEVFFQVSSDIYGLIIFKDVQFKASKPKPKASYSQSKTKKSKSKGFRKQARDFE